MFLKLSFCTPSRNLQKIPICERCATSGIGSFCIFATPPSPCNDPPNLCDDMPNPRNDPPNPRNDPPNPFNNPPNRNNDPTNPFNAQKNLINERSSHCDGGSNRINAKRISSMSCPIQSMTRPIQSMSRLIQSLHSGIQSMREILIFTIITKQLPLFFMVFGQARRASHIAPICRIAPMPPIFRQNPGHVLKQSTYRLFGRSFFGGALRWASRAWYMRSRRPPCSRKSFSSRRSCWSTR
jgi:hypothetical protein